MEVRPSPRTKPEAMTTMTSGTLWEGFEEEVRRAMRPPRRRAMVKEGGFRNPMALGDDERSTG